MDEKDARKRRRLLTETKILNGLKNAPVKHKKLKQPYTPPELFKLHTLAAFVGHRGSGKTQAIVTLTKKYLDEGSFNRIFVISPTYDSNPVFHVLEVNKKDVYTDHNSAIAAVEDILAKTRNDSDEFDKYDEYMAAYRRWNRGKSISSDEHTMLENNNFEKPPEVPRPSPLLIIDDMSHSDIYSTSRQNPFINLCLRHRHINFGKGISIFMAAQTFKSGIPLALRQNIQQFFVWPTHDSNQLEAIYHEVANLVDEDMFNQIYFMATKLPHSFLTIDTNASSTSKQFRRNFDTFLNPKTLDSNSDDESESDR